MGKRGDYTLHLAILLIKALSYLKGIQRNLIYLKFIQVTEILKSIDLGEVQMLLAMVNQLLISI